MLIMWVVYDHDDGDDDDDDDVQGEGVFEVFSEALHLKYLLL